MFCDPWLSRYRTFIERWRNPLSLPKEVSVALGCRLGRFPSFQQLAAALMQPGFHPRRLYKFMPRARAERVFDSALRIERFHDRTLCAYHLAGGWMECILSFDGQGQLRRLHVEHPHLNGGERVQLPLRFVHRTLRTEQNVAFPLAW
jgi:hypothetical protein